MRRGARCVDAHHHAAKAAFVKTADGLRTPWMALESAPVTAIAKAARGADLIVAVGYGHSRLGEWIFGGVTNDLLADPERFLLLSH